MFTVLAAALTLATSWLSPPMQPSKTQSVFFSPAVMERVRETLRRNAWAGDTVKAIVQQAEPWRAMSDRALWDLMFGPGITRSWMVWSNGYCPQCRKPVPMYNWKIDALKEPWKVRCPHCSTAFPTNDFAAYYRSGLDRRGLFDPARADRRLLFNAAHPDPADPLRTFGVDDGEGYIEGQHRWRFIGAYLIYGQWKQAIVGGIQALADAYVVTGDPEYARKAGILLDRVADLYPLHDFGSQGLVYEVKGPAGYVSVWHDACEETRELVLAYDRVFPGLRDNAELGRFLAERARATGSPNPKRTWADIQRNIESGLLRDPIANRHKIESNFPRTDVCIAIIEAALGWPANRGAVLDGLKPVLDRATAVDGVTGEKGLAGYAAFTINGLAGLLAQFDRIDPDFLPELMRRHPNLRKTYRFHVDTHCLGLYYPTCGDAGAFAAPYKAYAGATFTRQPGLAPSTYTLFYRLFEVTGDPVYLQVLYRTAGTLQNLPHDIAYPDTEGYQAKVRSELDRAGEAPALGSVNKEQWCLAILRAGADKSERALWLDYDSGGPHGHADGLNLGLYAYGLDLLPDFGYPPVQYGGWGSPRARWYTSTAAHNTVLVDGANQKPAKGQSDLWSIGPTVQAVRAAVPETYGIARYERTALLVSVSDDDLYAVDVLRVAGGRDHVKFVRGPFGTLDESGLPAGTPADLAIEGQMRGYRGAAERKPGWWVEWHIEDVRKVNNPPRDVRMTYWDFTEGAEAGVAESWISTGLYDGTGEAWIPTVVVRRRSAEEGLESCFVSLLAPYEKAKVVTAAARLRVEGQAGQRAALALDLAGGMRDLLLLADPLSPGEASVPEAALRSDAQVCLVRLSGGKPQLVALSGGTVAECGPLRVRLARPAPSVEFRLEAGRAVLLSGDPADIAEITLDGRRLDVAKGSP